MSLLLVRRFHFMQKASLTTCQIHCLEIEIDILAHYAIASHKDKKKSDFCLLKEYSSTDNNTFLITP